MQRSLLVVGGAGYIGSHMVKCLLEAGHDITILDDLSGGFEDSLLGGELVIGDCGDRDLLDRLFTKRHFDGVLHFASLIQVGESLQNPAKYYSSNTLKTLALLRAMVDHGVGPLIFSSTAAVYGEPHYSPIDESHPVAPINPYGASKMMVERMLQDFDLAYGLKSIALRYFNAAGADPQGRIGERHEPETHLIPLALHAALGHRPPLKVFGRDYETPDGTCVRDYIHVDDLAQAHLLALEHLWSGGNSGAFNLGNGAGFSVQQVLDAVGHIVGRPVPVQEAPRRRGDPANLVADASLAHKKLGWKPGHGELDDIVRHALKWEEKRVCL